MARLHYNLLQAVLDGDIDDNDLTITFTAPLREWGEDNIATIAAPDVLAIRIGYELLHITAYTSGASSATVIRGQEGSTATAHAEGDAIRHVITDLDLPNLSSYAALAGATFTGDVIVPDEAYDATAWNGSLEVPTKNAVRDKIETLGGGFVSDTAYGAGWDGDTTVAPSRNAVYDKIETLGAGSVSDTAYAGSWDGVTGIAPSKNAVYDKIETLLPVSQFKRQGGSSSVWATAGVTNQTITGAPLIQVGAYTFSATGSQAITFPTAYAQAPHVLVSFGDPTVNGRSVVRADTISASGFTLVLDNATSGSATAVVRWFAIGQ